LPPVERFDAAKLTQFARPAAGAPARSPGRRTLGGVPPADRPERGGPRVRLVGGIVVALLMAAILAAYIVVSRPWDLRAHRPAVHRSPTTSQHGT
jgi:hypothetical protein